MGGEPQFGNKGESFTDGEVRKKTIILADMSDALLHQLGRVGPSVNQNLTGRHCTAFITACYYVQQRCFTTTLEKKTKSTEINRMFTASMTLANQSIEKFQKACAT